MKMSGKVDISLMQLFNGDSHTVQWGGGAVMVIIWICALASDEN